MGAILEEAKHIFINTGYIWKYFYYNDDNKTMKRLSILVIVLLILLLLILVILVAIDAESNYIEGFGYSALGCLTLGILSILHALSYGIGSDYDVNHKKQSVNKEYKPKHKPIYISTSPKKPIYFITNIDSKEYTSDDGILIYDSGVPYIIANNEKILVPNLIRFYNEHDEEVNKYGDSLTFRQ